MLLIIKNKLDNNFNLENYSNFKEILLIDDGVYNILDNNLNLKNIKTNILENDLTSRGIDLSNFQKDQFKNINIIDYDKFVELTVIYKHLFI